MQPPVFSFFFFQDGTSAGQGVRSRTGATQCVGQRSSFPEEFRPRILRGQKRYALQRNLKRAWWRSRVTEPKFANPSRTMMEAKDKIKTLPRKHESISEAESGSDNFDLLHRGQRWKHGSTGSLHWQLLHLG